MQLGLLVAYYWPGITAFKNDITLFYGNTDIRITIKNFNHVTKNEMSLHLSIFSGYLL